MMTRAQIVDGSVPIGSDLHTKAKDACARLINAADDRLIRFAVQRDCRVVQGFSSNKEALKRALDKGQAQSMNVSAPRLLH
jgi:hypothetical protein